MTAFLLLLCALAAYAAWTLYTLGHALDLDLHDLPFDEAEVDDEPHR